MFRADSKSWQCSMDDYELKPTAEALPVSNALSQNVPRVSTRTGPETSLHFVNQTKCEVFIYWIDENGERHAYGKVDAGQQRQQHTYSGHVWVATDRAGTTLARFQAQEEPGRAEITEQSNATLQKAPAEPRRRKAASTLTPRMANGEW